MDKYRNSITLNYYEQGMEDGWETIRAVNKLNKDYLQNVVKKYCGKGFQGKTFRIAYLMVNNERRWIRVKDNPVIGNIFTLRDWKEYSEGFRENSKPQCGICNRFALGEFYDRRWRAISLCGVCKKKLEESIN